MHKHVLAGWVTAMLLLPSAFALDRKAALDLAGRRGCLACHAVEKPIVGPSWREVSTKYAGDVRAEALLMQRIRNGSEGFWGEIPMPPNPGLEDDELRALVRFVLSLR